MVHGAYGPTSVPVPYSVLLISPKRGSLLNYQAVNETGTDNLVGSLFTTTLVSLPSSCTWYPRNQFSTGALETIDSQPSLEPL